MKILCPIDFRPRARVAAQLAVSLAQRTSGSVELLHVLPAQSGDVLGMAFETAVLASEIRANAAARLVAETCELAAPGVTLSSRLADPAEMGAGGDVVSSILARAYVIGADLIVMAAHERPAIERFILGSVAERTVRRANRPVLIVPPGVQVPLGDGKPGGHLHALVALDGRPSSRGALELGRTLRGQLADQVTFVRLYWPPEEQARLGLTTGSLLEPDPAITADLARSVTEEVGALAALGGTSIAIEPAWGDPAAALLAFARTRRCDLIVMGAESRHGLSRLSHVPVAGRVAHHATDVPVVFVPTPPAVRGSMNAPEISTVLAATDLSENGNHAVGYAYASLGRHGGVVELCHVRERGREEKLTDLDRARLHAELRALVPKDVESAGISTHLTVIEGGKPAPSILQAAERLRVDSIVVGARGGGALSRALLGSVSEEVVRHARRPVLVVPRSSDAS